MPATPPDIKCSVLKVISVRYYVQLLSGGAYIFIVTTRSSAIQFELKDLLENIFSKFNHLDLILAPVEDEGATHLLRETRATMAEQATTILYAVGYTNDISRQMLELLGAVAEDPVNTVILEAIYYASRWAGNTAKLFERGDEGVTELIKEMTTVAERIASLLGDGKSGMFQVMTNVPLGLINTSSFQV